MKVATIPSIRARTDEDIAKLVGVLEHQKNTRKDYIVPAKKFSAAYDPFSDMVKFGFPVIDGVAPVMFEPTARAHHTLRYRFDISKGYYDKMSDQAPDLLAYNINYWAERDNHKYMFRTLDDKVRAVMSNQFRVLDNTELFFTTYETVKEVGAKIVQADLTEDNFYMKVLHPEWAVKVDGFRTDVWQRKTNRPGGSLYHVIDHLEDDGDQWLVPGLIVSNSDVGAGSLHAELFIFDTICWNGLVHNRTLHQVHLGKRLDEGLLVSNETRELEDRAVWSHVKDMIKVGFDKENFLDTVKRLQNASEVELEDSVQAVDTVVKNFGFSDEDRQNILNELVSAGSPTVYGLLTAVTAVGRDKENQDETIKFERAGGDILSDPREFVRARRGTRATRAKAPAVATA